MPQCDSSKGGTVRCEVRFDFGTAGLIEVSEGDERTDTQNQ